MIKRIRRGLYYGKLNLSIVETAIEFRPDLKDFFLKKIDHITTLHAPIILACFEYKVSASFLGGAIAGIWTELIGLQDKDRTLAESISSNELNNGLADLIDAQLGTTIFKELMNAYYGEQGER